jgi:pantoate--beta-alanine ligase
MKVYSTINGLREAVSVQKKQFRSIGFVPTMGYLHAGHMALVARARSQNDIVVASIFVNPLQFGPDEDLQRYPRDLARDATMLREAGVSILFAPGVEDMYQRALETVVEVPRLGSEMEGAVRPGHFSGVATVVCKLFNIVQPDRAYFGEKDFQQAVVIKRMVDDLSIPVEIVNVPTVRDVDGLAMSSRNIYLSSAERRTALVIPRALDVAELLVKDGLTDVSEIERRLLEFLKGEPMAKPEIVAVRDAETLCRVDKIDRPVVVALFVRVGLTRLLDNRVISVRGRAERRIAEQMHPETQRCSSPVRTM